MTPFINDIRCIIHVNKKRQFRYFFQILCREEYLTFFKVCIFQPNADVVHIKTTCVYICYNDLSERAFLSALAQFTSQNHQQQVLGRSVKNIHYLHQGHERIEKRKNIEKNRMDKIKTDGW